MKDKPQVGQQVPDLSPHQSVKDWIDKVTATSRYFFSDSTLRRLVKRGLVNTSKMGRKILYYEPDLKQILSSNIRPGFAMIIEAVRPDMNEKKDEAMSENEKLPVRKPWYKRHRYYSELLVIFLLFMFWLLMPTSIHAGTLFKDSTRYGFGIALIIAVLAANLLHEPSDNKKLKEEETVTGSPIKKPKQTKTIHIFLYSFLAVILMFGAGFFIGVLGIPQKLHLSVLETTDLITGALAIPVIILLIRMAIRARKRAK